MILMRAEERYESVQDGIVTKHCFSAGSHYDPANVSFGPLVGVDEHCVDPGAGFAEHAHRGVEIISWVADGLLHHRSNDVDQVINAGESLIQEARDGMRHSERNGSDDNPLRLIQTTLLTGSGVEFDVLRATAEVQAPWVHLFVVDGAWSVDDIGLAPGDSMRLSDNVAHRIEGSGTVLSLRSSAIPHL